MTSPPTWAIELAKQEAACSPCRSKRGVVVYSNPYDRTTPPCLYGSGFNSPPNGECPGRAVCAGKCGRMSIHAEMRALRGIELPLVPMVYLVHVELTPDGTGIVACAGPSCEQCSKHILAAGFVRFIWLYEATSLGGKWVARSPLELHRTTMKNVGAL